MRFKILLVGLVFFVALCMLFLISVCHRDCPNSRRIELVGEQQLGSLTDFQIGYMVGNRFGTICSFQTGDVVPSTYRYSVNLDGEWNQDFVDGDDIEKEMKWEWNIVAHSEQGSMSLKSMPHIVFLGYDEMGACFHISFERRHFGPCEALIGFPATAVKESKIDNFMVNFLYWIPWGDPFVLDRWPHLETLPAKGSLYKGGSYQPTELAFPFSYDGERRSGIIKNSPLDVLEIGNLKVGGLVQGCAPDLVDDFLRSQGAPPALNDCGWDGYYACEGQPDSIIQVDGRWWRWLQRDVQGNLSVAQFGNVLIGENPAMEQMLILELVYDHHNLWQVGQAQTFRMVFRRNPESRQIVGECCVFFRWNGYIKHGKLPNHWRFLEVTKPELPMVASWFPRKGVYFGRGMQEKSNSNVDALEKLGELERSNPNSARKTDAP